MKVEVYRNLHQKCWSVRDAKTGLVIDHKDNIHIQDATLVVRPAGRKKVLQEQRKNVHAFIRGTTSDATLSRQDYLPKLILTDQITYNPYKYDSFVLTESEEPITHAKHIYLDRQGQAFIGESIYD